MDADGALTGAELRLSFFEMCFERPGVCGAVTDMRIRAKVLQMCRADATTGQASNSRGTDQPAQPTTGCPWKWAKSNICTYVCR